LVPYQLVQALSQRAERTEYLALIVIKQDAKLVQKIHPFA
jgi:hypothetical protein